MRGLCKIFLFFHEPFYLLFALINRCTKREKLKGECEIEERELIILIQKGDLTAFDKIFEKYKDKAVRTAYLITGNRSICEDIAQEAFIQCYRHIGELRNPDGFRAWFYRILTRVAWKDGKAAAQEVATDNIMEDANKINLDNSLEQQLRSETNRILYSQIALLEPKLKTVVILYYFNDLSTKEVAKVVGCLEGTVKSRLHTARQKLRKRMESIDSQEKECAKNARCKIV